MLLFLKNLLFTLIVPGTVGILVPLLIVPHAEANNSGISLGSYPLLLSGALIYTWCIWDFATFGRGTPAPIDPPTRLVIRGLYRFSRNPMYVGVLTLIAGWSLLFLSSSIALYGAAVGVGFHLFIRHYEEPKLLELFGDEYREYRKRVRRWV